MGKRIQKAGSGVFDYLTDEVAFVDIVQLSQWGRISVEPENLNRDLLVDPSFPIAAPGRSYGHAMNGFCTTTGNHFQQRFGRLRSLPRIPDSQLLLRSEMTPLTCAQTEMVANGLKRQGVRTTVSLVEVTLDLSGTTVDFFLDHLGPRARTFTLLWDEIGRRTFYIAGRRSSWQARAYDKAEGLLRLEFIFRRGFLRKHGIDQPHQILRIRHIDLGRLIWMWQLDQHKLREFERNIRSDYRTRALCYLGRRSTTREFAVLLRELGSPRPDIFRSCPIEDKLRRMLLRLMW